MNEKLERHRLNTKKIVYLLWNKYIMIQRLWYYTFSHFNMKGV